MSHYKKLAAVVFPVTVQSCPATFDRDLTNTENYAMTKDIEFNVDEMWHLGSDLRLHC